MATTPLITKPLLADKVSNVEDVKFPVLATPKIDGIRALKVGGQLLSRQFKPIHNVTIKNTLEQLLPEGSDGEITVPGTFQDVSSKVMSVSKGVDFREPFTFYWFDYVSTDALRPYSLRIKDMEKYVDEHPEILRHPQATIVPLIPKRIDNHLDLSEYENGVLGEGFEGVMIRHPDGKYKMGRSTVRDGILLKLKKFDDAEAKVVAVHEMMHNENEATLSELGVNKRSHKKEGMLPASKLGALEVINDAGEQFCIGSGFTDKQRCELWKEREKLIDKLVKYRYFKMGSKSAPRFPTFLGFRDPDDL
jgi:DNA ligase-1